jgi:hypothetical protein
VLKYMSMIFFHFLKIIFYISTSKRFKKYKPHLILTKKKNSKFNKTQLQIQYQTVTKFHWLNIGSNYMIVPTKCFKNAFHFKKIICRANPWLGISCWWDATSTKQKKEHDNACYCLTAYFRERESCHLTAAPHACLLLREYLWV